MRAGESVDRDTRVLLAFAGAVVATGIALGVAVAVGRFPAAPPARGTLVVRAGALFDGTGDAARDDAVVVIEGDRVACVGARCRIPDGARVIEAADLALLPGLVDLEIHLGSPRPSGGGRWLPLVMLDYARLMPTQRRLLLEAGITTIRELGNILGTARAIAHGIATGALAGPHVHAVGPIFTAPMGIPVATDLGGNIWVIEHGTRQVDDADEARREVARLADDGFAGVAVVSDGGIVDRLPRLDPAVLRAIVAEAHARGLWVAVVTGRVRDVREAVLAGADTIEHGPIHDGPLPADVIELLRARGVTYVPALAGGEAFLGWLAQAERPDGFSAESWDALRAAVRERGPLGTLGPSLESVRAAASAGVRIGAGPGSATELSATLDRELALLVEAGLTPAAALRAATRDAAIALRAENDLGTIAPGKLADLVLVAGRPWERIDDVRAVRLVIQAGRVVVDRR